MALLEANVVDVVAVVVVALIVVTDHIIFIVVVNLRLLKATIEFLWWGGLHSHFYVQPNNSVEVVLCCRWGFDKKGGISNQLDLNILKIV